MNIEKLKKKYPYKRTKARIIKIETISEESGYFTDYTIRNAEYDLYRKNDKHINDSWSNNRYDEYDLYAQVHRHAHENSGYVEYDTLGNPVSKIYETWYTYRLLLEFADLSGKTFCVQVDNRTRNQHHIGDKTVVYYKIDNPNIVKFDSSDCIDDFYESLNLGFICSALIVASIVIPTVITKFRRDT